MRRISWIVLATLCVVGCAKEDSKSGGTADSEADAVRRAEDVGDRGKDRGAETSRQAEDRGTVELPKGFPIFPGAAPNPEIPRSDEFRWDTAQPIPEVGDYYEAELEKSGAFEIFQRMRASTKAQVLVFRRVGEAVPAGRISFKPGPNGEGTTILLHLD